MPNYARSIFWWGIFLTVTLVVPPGLFVLTMVGLHHRIVHTLNRAELAQNIQLETYTVDVTV